MIDYQIGNEQHDDINVHFLFENQLLVELEVGSGSKRDPKNGSAAGGWKLTTTILSFKEEALENEEHPSLSVPSPLSPSPAASIPITASAIIGAS